MRNGSAKKSKRRRRTPEHGTEIELGSGNVFADLGLPNPHIALAKAELVQRIRQLIADQALTQSQAAGLLGIDQPKISALVRGQVEGYSIDRLFRFLNALGQRVEISVRPANVSRKSHDERLVCVT